MRQRRHHPQESTQRRRFPVVAGAGLPSECCPPTGALRDECVTRSKSYMPRAEPIRLPSVSTVPRTAPQAASGLSRDGRTDSTNAAMTSRTRVSSRSSDRLTRTTWWRSSREARSHDGKLGGYLLLTRSRSDAVVAARCRQSSSSVAARGMRFVSFGLYVVWYCAERGKSHTAGKWMSKACRMCLASQHSALLTAGALTFRHGATLNLRLLDCHPQQNSRHGPEQRPLCGNRKLMRKNKSVLI
jgi:hypothetical protein